MFLNSFFFTVLTSQIEIKKELGGTQEISTAVFVITLLWMTVKGIIKYF